MTFVNRVYFDTSTTGTGNITVGTAVTGYRTPADAGLTTEIVGYVIEDGANYEVGYGTLSSAGTILARTTVLESSNSNLAINLSGSARVFFTVLKQDYDLFLTAPVANSALADMAEATLKGRASGAGTGAPTNLTATQVRTLLSLGALALLNTIANAQVDAAAAISLSKLQNISDARILGNNSGGAGPPIQLTATQAKALLAIAAGDVSGLGALATLSTISNAQVDASAAIALSKLQSIPTDRLVGNNSGVNAAPTSLSVAAIKLMLAYVASDISGLGALATLNTVGTAQIDNLAVTSAKIAANAVTTTEMAANAATNVVLADMDEGRIKARISAGTGNPQDATAAQIRTLLNVADGSETNAYRSSRLIGAGNNNSLLTDEMSLVRVEIDNGETCTYRLNGNVSHNTLSWIDLICSIPVGAGETATITITAINGYTIRSASDPSYSVNSQAPRLVRCVKIAAASWAVGSAA